MATKAQTSMAGPAANADEEAAPGEAGDASSAGPRARPRKAGTGAGAKTGTARTGAAKASDTRATAATGASRAAGAKSATQAAQSRDPDEADSFISTGPIHLAPTRLASLQAEYLARLKSLLSGGGIGEPHDRRFADDAWREGPFAFTANMYLLNSEFMQKMADAVEGDGKSRDRIRFATQQWIDAMSPANYLATNPEAQRRLIETQGESLKQGMRHALDDLQKGRITHTDESVFEVGQNMATTPGSVVYQNELFQLIQYAPSTPQVGRRPLLMVPPCINKFYILDLQPKNSVVAWAVAQGHTVFMLSWRNIQAPLGQLRWDDYIEDGVIEAVRIVREIAEVDQINALGFCVGGTLLANAAAVMAGVGDRSIASMTLLTTLLDFSDPGVLGIFIDENFVRLRERTIGGGGIMPGRELATTFNYLRPNDLVWNYVVSKYLKGEDPPPFDLLYWNADGTNLPGPMFCWYLRHTYLQNELRIPGKLSVCDVPVDLGAIGVPTYIYGSRDDHIVPWHGAYQSTRLLDGSLRFVLGASGHIAGVINPPAAGKRNYWTADTLPENADDWFSAATEHRGSWWPDWGEWLAGFKDGEREAPAEPGSARRRALQPAPGSYVKERAD